MPLARRDARSYLYESLADNLRGLIEDGTFACGHRLPSVRRLARQEGLSIATVLKAYEVLEGAGLIEARPQSGYYVRRRAQDLPAPPVRTRPPRTATTVDVGALAAELVETASRPDLTPFGGALPGPELLPLARLKRITAGVLRRPEAYSDLEIPPQGTAPLRTAVARRMLQAGCRVAPDDVLITGGCLEAVNLALRAVAQPGDVIGVESPTYFGALQAIENLDMRALELSTDPEHGICPDELCAAAREGRIRAALLMPNVHNPLGGIMPDTNKRRITATLGELGVPVIEDDTYGESHFGADARPRALKAFDGYDNVIYCSSFSKQISPAQRIGWMLPGRWLSRVRVLKASSTVAANGLAQATVAAFLAQGGFDRHLRRQRRAFAANIDRVLDGISRHFPAGTRVTRPRGGYLLWVQVPGIDARELYRRALDAGISIAPGRLFSARDAFSDFFRLNCGHSWSPRLEAGLVCLGALAHELLLPEGQGFYGGASSVAPQ